MNLHYRKNTFFLIDLMYVSQSCTVKDSNKSSVLMPPPPHIFSTYVLSKFSPPYLIYGVSCELCVQISNTRFHPVTHSICASLSACITTCNLPKNQKSLQQRWAERHQWHHPYRIFISSDAWFMLASIISIYATFVVTECKSRVGLICENEIENQ